MKIPSCLLPPASCLSSTSPFTTQIEAVLADRPVNPDQKPSIGCNIKWKPGNEPAYYTWASRRRGLWQWLAEQLKPRFLWGQSEPL